MTEHICTHSVFMDEFVDERFDGIRAPFTAGFELTAKCNLNCVHCYAKPGRHHKDMTTQEFKDIVDVLIDRGLLDAYLTGGEIFVRKDFAELYRYLKSKGVLVSLLTNITLLNEQHIDLFKEYPVEVISTSMYGYTEESYEAVTGVKGSYQEFMRALDLIRAHNLPFELKFVAMKQNIHELHEVRKFGCELGVPMVIILDVHPASDGSTEPMLLRLTPEEAFDFDLKDLDRREFWEEVARQLLAGEIGQIPSMAKERFQNGYLYPCSVAHQHVFITSDYKMQGCVRASYNQFDLRKGSFDEGWEYLQKEFLDKKATSNYPCNTCNKIRFCEHCVANFKLTYDDEEHVDPFFCEVASLRKEFVDNHIKHLITQSSNGN